MIILNIPKTIAIIEHLPTKISFKDALSINEILNSMNKEYPSLYERITISGELSPFVGFYFHDEVITDFGQPIPQNNEITLFCAIAGG